MIEFKDDEIDMKQSLFVENCSNCGILVKAKVKSIFLQKCEKVELVFDVWISLFISKQFLVLISLTVRELKSHA